MKYLLITATLLLTGCSWDYATLVGEISKHIQNAESNKIEFKIQDQGVQVTCRWTDINATDDSDTPIVILD